MPRGMVCAPQPEAVETGVEVLSSGGNAVDAAIATAFEQCVIDPLMCGVAGFGSMQILPPGSGQPIVLDFHARAPFRATSDMWTDLVVSQASDGNGFVVAGYVNDYGYQSLTAPLGCAGLVAAARQFGTWPLDRLLQPAIRRAHAGFPVRPAMHTFFTQPAQYGRVSTLERLRCTPAAARLYLDDDGAALSVGAIIRNPDFAAVLERLATDGLADFYAGDTAAMMLDDLDGNGGLLDERDLTDIEPRQTSPLTGRYRRHRVATNPPPGGGLMLLQMLGMLEHIDLASLGHNSPRYIAVVAEAMKRATVDKDRFMGDPEAVDVPVPLLMDEQYLAVHAAEIQGGQLVSVDRHRGLAESPHTTQVTVVDGAGGCVSLTHSLGSSAGVVTDGLGFMYANGMGGFDPRPRQAGSVAPGRRRFSSICPTIVFTGDRPSLVIGAPGGTQIPMGILQSILNVIDFDMTPAEAVSAPRFCATSDVVELSNRIPQSTADAVQRLGHRTRKLASSYAVAAVHLISIDPADPGVLAGGADPAADGMALAADPPPPNGVLE